MSDTNSNIVIDGLNPSLAEKERIFCSEVLQICNSFRITVDEIADRVEEKMAAVYDSTWDKCLRDDVSSKAFGGHFTFEMELHVKLEKSQLKGGKAEAFKNKFIAQRYGGSKRKRSEGQAHDESFAHMATLKDRLKHDAKMFAEQIKGGLLQDWANDDAMSGFGFGQLKHYIASNDGDILRADELFVAHFKGGDNNVVKSMKVELSHCHAEVLIDAILELHKEKSEWVVGANQQKTTIEETDPRRIKLRECFEYIKCRDDAAAKKVEEAEVLADGYELDGNAKELVEEVQKLFKKKKSGAPLLRKAKTLADVDRETLLEAMQSEPKGFADEAERQDFYILCRIAKAINGVAQEAKELPIKEVHKDLKKIYRKWNIERVVKAANLEERLAPWVSNIGDGETIVVERNLDISPETAELLKYHGAEFLLLAFNKDMPRLEQWSSREKAIVTMSDPTALATTKDDLKKVNEQALEKYGARTPE